MPYSVFRFLQEASKLDDHNPVVWAVFSLQALHQFAQSQLSGSSSAHDSERLWSDALRMFELAISLHLDEVHTLSYVFFNVLSVLSLTHTYDSTLSLQ